ncbi:DNA-binding barrel domain superfamily [Sesbania bispinosa]|nr:DNA-binding barrel domain superfamily [Sesbania bispinosa]
MAGVGTSRNYEHVDFPRDFYEARKKELGNRVELHDPKGNILRLPLFYGPKVLLWESTQGVGYEKENKFYVEIWDEKFEEIVYPDRVECLPKRFVDGFLKREWDNLRLLVEGGGEYVCKLLWSTRNLSECNLGKDWYKFVEDMDVGSKDKVQFRGGSRDVNVVNVRVIRRWQY